MTPTPDDLAPLPAPPIPGWLYVAAAVFCAGWALGALLHAALRLLEALTT